MTVIEAHELEQMLEGLSRSTKPNTANKGMGNNARTRFNKMIMAVFMSREAGRSIKKARSASEASGKKQIF